MCSSADGVCTLVTRNVLIVITSPMFQTKATTEQTLKTLRLKATAKKLISGPWINIFQPGNYEVKLLTFSFNVKVSSYQHTLWPLWLNTDFQSFDLTWYHVQPVSSSFSKHKIFRVICLEPFCCSVRCPVQTDNPIKMLFPLVIMLLIPGEPFLPIEHRPGSHH